MAGDLPPPRSYSQIYGEQVDTFLSRTALPEIKVGSPVNSLFAAAAQSNARSIQDVFAASSANDLNRAKGADLDAIGERLRRPRQRETASSGAVAVSDTTVTRVATVVYQGLPAPVAGTASVRVADASAFPATGSVYLGRGTKNYEGPVAYGSKTDLGTHWKLDLSAPTTAFHNLGESVTLAQGGNRTVRAGTVVQTAQGNAAEATRFTVQYDSVLPDGESHLPGVRVVAQRRGTGGNVPAGSVAYFAAAPFLGAAVANALPFTNALPTWDDETYREVLRSAPASAAMGTDLAVVSHVVGATALDEAATVRSASVVHSATSDTLVVDDGTGYEEKSAGIPLDILADSALGGELDFGLSSSPVAKASVTSARGPFAVDPGSVLSVEVGGRLYTHAFAASDFRDASAAEALEVAAAIDADESLAFVARTAEGQTRVVLVAKAEQDEDVEVVATEAPEADANGALQFPTGRHATAHLYLNGAELSKDGRAAALLSEPQASWSAASGSQTLALAVDHTATVTYTFTDADFAPSGYSTLSTANSLAAWASVLNAKLPGVTASVAGDRLQLSSNLGASARAAVEVSGGTLAGAAGMFTAASAAGRARDYLLDRNTGEVHLLAPLAPGDALAAGSPDPRASISGSALGVLDLASDAHVWLIPDSASEAVPSGLTPSSTVTVSEYVASPPVSWGKRVRIAADSGAPFTAVQVGDWAVHLDSNFSSANRDAWRVAHVDSGGTYYEIERSSFTAEAGVAVSSGGIVFARTSGILQRATAAAGADYTASSLADALSDGIRGARFLTYKTAALRARTDAFGLAGDIAVVAADSPLLGLAATGDAVPNGVDHRAAVAAASREDGTPQFDASTQVAFVSGEALTLASTAGWSAGHIARWRRSLPDTDSAAARSRFGPNFGATSPLESVTGSVITVRRSALQEYLPSDRVVAAAPYAFGPEDDLVVVVDRDLDTKRYSVNLHRRLTPTTSTYGTTNSFTDLDAGGASLAASFGLDYDFDDYAVLMRARAKSHAEAGDTTKTILWRYSRFGASGDAAVVRYTYPRAALAGVSVSVNPDFTAVPSPVADNVFVEISLPAGPARTGVSVRNSTRVGVFAAAFGGDLQTLTYVLGFAIASATRNVVLRYTARGATVFAGTVTGGTSGATGTVATDSLAGGSTGAGTLRLSAVTGAFAAGEALTGTTGAATSSGGQVGETVLTLDIATPGTTDCGLSASDVVWVRGSGSYSTGPFVLTAATSSTVTYLEGTTSAAAATSVGTVSADFAGEATLAGSTAISGDIAAISAASSLPAGYLNPVRMSGFGDQYWSGVAETLETVGAVAWYDLNDASALAFFPIDSSANQASQIAAAVNVIAAVQGQACPVTAVAVGNGASAAGQISLAGYEEFSTILYGYALADGLNWVRSEVAPTTPSQNYTFTFKAPVTAALASNSDWAAEEVRIVPGTAQNVVDHLASQGTGGLGNSAEVLAVSGGARPQIASLSPGSAGAVQVLGGLGNAASAGIVGSARPVNGTQYTLVSCAASEARGIAGGAWVDVQNSAPAPRAVFGPTTSLTSLDASGNFVLAVTPAWTFANTAAALVSGFRWQVERVGRYVAYRWDGVGSAPSLAGVPEGAYVTVSAGIYSVSAQNTGTFRIVRVRDSEHIFWVENARALPEIATASLWFVTWDSVLPGDSVVIGSSVWGAENTGTWTVESTDSGNPATFKVDVSARATVPLTGPVVLGASAPLVQCREGEPSKLVKQVVSVSPAGTAAVDVKLSTGVGYGAVGAAYGSRLVALDKLGFPTTLAEGSDGYARVTGLLGEVTKILYGDPADPAVYPGVASSGADIAVSGPLIRAVVLSLSLRLRTGAARRDVFAAVRSAVAAAVARSGVGEPVAVSSVVEAAASVNGVVSVVVLSPAYGPGNDLVPAQPLEKLLVLDPERDITLSVVGS